MLLTNATGVKQGPTATYDPFGGSLTTLPDNQAGNFDNGWLGSKQRYTEHEGTLNTIEMGARQYIAGLGRFIEVDPVEGGSSSDYDYVDGDPVNGFDLNGEAHKKKKQSTGNKKDKHEKGAARSKADRGGEKGDVRRPYSGGKNTNQLSPGRLGRKIGRGLVDIPKHFTSPFPDGIVIAATPYIQPWI